MIRYYLMSQKANSSTLIGAVIKCLLRRMEQHEGFKGYRYCSTWADIFVFLAQHFSDTVSLNVDGVTEVEPCENWFGDTKKRINSIVSRMRFHYIKTVCMRVRTCVEGWETWESASRMHSYFYLILLHTYPEGGRG